MLANMRMLGASNRPLVCHVDLSSATSWVFSSRHTSVGLAFVGAVGRIERRLMKWQPRAGETEKL